MLDLANQIYISEGAMGTMLLRQGLDPKDNSAYLNLENPQAIVDTHRQYYKAGATCATTNSFSICTSDDKNDQALAAKMVKASVDLARKGNPDGLVFGDVGPCALVLEPLGSTSFETAYDAYRRHVEALVSRKPDAILLETFIDIADIRCAILAIKDCTDLPIIASCTFNTDSRMPLSSTTPAAAALICEKLGVDAVGMNCGLGPKEALKIIQEMISQTALPLIVQPNAGLPILKEDGSVIYPGTPEEMASFALDYVGVGATIIGSCCGSDPTFTKEIAVVLKEAQPYRNMHNVHSKSSGKDSLVNLASMSDVVQVNTNQCNFDDYERVDCSDSSTEKWDILELTTLAPIVFESDNQFESKNDLQRLDIYLKLYSGIAFVNGDINNSALKTVCAKYGAVLI